MATPPSPSRLLALPPEIRNAIWELSFSGTDREVDMFESHPPSAELLLACRQIHEEAKGFWPGRRGDYFSTTSFTITSLASIPQAAASLSDRDIAAINHIKLLVRVRDIKMLGSPRRTPKVYGYMKYVLSRAPDRGDVLNCVRLSGGSRDWESENLWDPGMLQKVFVTFGVRNDNMNCAAWMHCTEWIPGLPFTPITRKELSVLLGRDI
ncbi:hypothetical protein LTR15_007751 [Elasticomyces elasticus]|nr:hypothetical protein LTR15_007751 [Elasticomyces elasticus]